MMISRAPSNNNNLLDLRDYAIPDRRKIISRLWRNRERERGTEMRRLHVDVTFCSARTPHAAYISRYASVISIWAVSGHAFSAFNFIVTGTLSRGILFKVSRRQERVDCEEIMWHFLVTRNWESRTRTSCAACCVLVDRATRHRWGPSTSVWNMCLCYEWVREEWWFMSCPEEMQRKGLWNRSEWCSACPTYNRFGKIWPD